MAARGKVPPVRYPEPYAKRPRLRSCLQPGEEGGPGRSPPYRPRPLRLWPGLGFGLPQTCPVAHRLPARGTGKSSAGWGSRRLPCPTCSLRNTSGPHPHPTLRSCLAPPLAAAPSLTSPVPSPTACSWAASPLRATLPGPRGHQALWTPLPCAPPSPRLRGRAAVGERSRSQAVSGHQLRGSGHLLSRLCWCAVA